MFLMEIFMISKSENNNNKVYYFNRNIINILKPIIYVTLIF